LFFLLLCSLLARLLFDFRIADIDAETDRHKLCLSYLAILLEDKKNSLKSAILVTLEKQETRNLWNMLHRIPPIASKEVKYEGDNAETDYLSSWVSLQDALKECEQNNYTKLAHAADSYFQTRKSSGNRQSIKTSPSFLGLFQDGKTAKSSNSNVEL
jgi:hypothetical protein